MASKLIVPFNYQPFSVTVRTTAYTIPAGFYAYVEAYCEAGQTFSIDGVLAMQGRAAIAASVTSADVSAVGVTAVSTNLAQYTVPAGYYFKGTASKAVQNAVFNVQVTGANVTTSPTSTLAETTYFVAGSGALISVSAGTGAKYIAGASIRGSTVNSGQSGVPVTGSFWVKEGNALTTTGRYTVTLYPNIS